MRNIIGILALSVTLLTLFSLLLDLPQKLGSLYESIMKPAPTVIVEALFSHQDAITVGHVTDDKSRGYNRFVAPSTYELHNVSGKNVTITSITNRFNRVEIGAHVLSLVQRPDNDTVFKRFDSFKKLTDDDSKGVIERLPYTIKAGDKIYVEVFMDYSVRDKGEILFCKRKKHCLTLLGASLGVKRKENGALPCVLKKYQTKISYVNYSDEIYNQKAILPIVGCKLNTKFIEEMFKP